MDKSGNLNVGTLDGQVMLILQDGEGHDLLVIPMQPWQAADLAVAFLSNACELDRAAVEAAFAERFLILPEGI